MATFRLNSKASADGYNLSIGNEEFKVTKKGTIKTDDPGVAADLRGYEFLTEVDDETTGPAVAGSPAGEGE